MTEQTPQTALETQKQTVEQKLERVPTLFPISQEVKLYLAKRKIEEATWNTLKRSIFPGASDESVILAIDYCTARKLDVLKKPVHIVPMLVSTGVKDANGYDKKEYRDVIMAGISEIRTTAMRTGEYMGTDGEEFGPDIVKQFGVGKEAKEHTFPEWCRYVVYRSIDGKACRFVGPKVYWIEAYASKSSKNDEPNSMWATRPRGQLSKCAEAAALRFTFPEQLGSDYAAEEMEGKQFSPRDVTPPAQNISATIGAAIKQAQAEASEPPAKVIDVEPEAPQTNPIEHGEHAQSPEPQGDGVNLNQEGN